MQCYMISLTNDEDEFHVLVAKDTWDWINNEDVSPPEKQVDMAFRGIYNHTSREEIKENMRRWEGSSPDNDRALEASPDYGEVFLTAKEAIKFAQKNAFFIKDVFTGALY